MKTFKYLAVIALAIACFSLQAGASLINLGQFSTTGPIGSPPAERQYLIDNFGAPSNLTYLNKFEAGGGFQNDGAVNATGHFSATLTNGGADALVTWNLLGTGFQLSYVLVKDGVNPTTKRQLYHLYGVTNDQAFNSITAQLVTINHKKGISHITFFGVPGNAVPDGGATVALLGIALGGLGAMRRFINH